MASQIAPPYRFTVDDVLAMYRAGILDDRDRVELVDGVLVQLTPPGPQHAAILQRLNKHFVRAVDDPLHVRVQDALLSPDGGFLLPDLVVIESVPDDELPDTARLVVEVSYTSRPLDIEKAVTYAAAGVPDYWLVDITRGEVLVHRLPGASGYARVERFAPGDMLAPLVDVPPLDVATLLAH